MKLLLDQNISHRLAAHLQTVYPDTSQVALLDLGEASDSEIWELARSQDYAIVTHDADFEVMSILEGGPPLIIWLRCGNQPQQDILDRLLQTARSFRPPQKTRISGALRFTDPRKSYGTKRNCHHEEGLERF